MTRTPFLRRCIGWRHLLLLRPSLAHFAVVVAVVAAVVVVVAGSPSAVAAVVEDSLSAVGTQTERKSHQFNSL